MDGRQALILPKEGATPQSLCQIHQVQMRPIRKASFKECPNVRGPQSRKMQGAMRKMMQIRTLSITISIGPPLALQTQDPPGLKMVFTYPIRLA